jgi:uncharacterized protein (TIGR00251 family)
MLSIKETAEGVTFPVRVLPRSSRNEVAGITGDALKVKLTAPPVEGAANKLLIEFLSEKLRVPKSRIGIVSGQTGRNKLVSVSGMNRDELSKLLA